MPLGSGLAAQLGVGLEASFGTPVTVSRFLPLISEGLELGIERLESEGIVAGRRAQRSDQWEPGVRMVEGDVEMDFLRQGMAGLWVAAFGTVSTTTTGGASTHTITPGDLRGAAKSLTLQVGRPQVGGVVVPFTYSGCKIASWEVTAEAGSLARVTFSVVGQEGTTATALATATYPQGHRAFTFINGSISIGGSAVANVRSFTLSGDNGLSDDRTYVGGEVYDEPVEVALRRYEATMAVEWASTNDYLRFRDGTEASVVLSLSASTTESAIFTMNMRYDGYPVTVDGTEILQPEVPMVAVAPTDDASAISLALRNAQATPV